MSVLLLYHTVPALQQDTPCSISTFAAFVDVWSITSLPHTSLVNVVLFDQIDQLVRLCHEVQWRCRADLISHPIRNVSAVQQPCSTTKTYRCCSWKLSSLALHLQLKILQFASEKISATCLSSTSLISISSSADLPMINLPVSSKQLTQS